MSLHDLPSEEALLEARMAARAESADKASKDEEQKGSEGTYLSDPARFLDDLPDKLEKAASEDENSAMVRRGALSFWQAQLLSGAADKAVDELAEQGFSAQRTGVQQTHNWKQSDFIETGLYPYYVTLTVDLPNQH